jgi:TRAP-type transport system periplasmic protein
MSATPVPIREDTEAMTRTALRLGGYQPASSVHSRALHYIAATLNERLPAAFAAEIDIDVTRRGYRAADLLAMVADGRLDGCYFASSHLLAKVPSLAVFDLPFAAVDRARDYAKLDGAFGVRLATDVATRTPFRVLGYWDNGFRHISNRTRPIRHPGDCGGLTMRTLDSALHQDVFAALGFTPVFIDVKDLTTAVANGLVDAQENPLTNFVNFGLYRHHRHVSLTAHFFGVALFLVNEAWYAALPDELRAGLYGSVSAATARQREMAMVEDERCLDVLAREGVAVVDAGDIDFTAFKAAVAPVVEREVARLAGG